MVSQTVTWRQLIGEAQRALDTSLGGDRKQEARWLVERVSGYSASELILNQGELVSARAVAFFDQLVARRCAGEPLQYVLGRWSFRSLELLVDSRVLIPRPETEMVAGLAIDHLRTYDRATKAVDLGCGSGAIALSVASEVANVSVWACDVSADALAVTRANLAGLGRSATRVTVAEGSWFDALPKGLRGTFDAVVSNPPYVMKTEALPQDVKDWEPHLALFGDGENGDAFVNYLIDEAPGWLAPGGLLVIEMAPQQTAAALHRATVLGFHARVAADFAEKPRALVARLPS
jgi:release factor glutamine methyltransferase